MGGLVVLFEFFIVDGDFGIRVEEVVVYLVVLSVDVNIVWIVLLINIKRKFKMK